MKKQVYIQKDSFTDIVSKCFDYKFDGISCFESWEKPDVPNSYNLGVIVGASGTGKSTLLNEFGKEEIITWDQCKAIISHFSSPEDGIDRLSAVGLNSIPSWCRPYHVLSTGEKFRADLARRIKNNVVIDEFTSVIDRNVAKATSVSFSKYIRKNNISNIIVATCHEDILEWLEPDWIFNTNNGQLSVGRYLQRPEINISIYSCKHTLWSMFKNHHYLTGNLNKASRCYIGLWNNAIVSFSAAITFPNGNLKNAWREHRTVVLPDYQGMGIGVTFSDAIAQLFIDEGKRYFSRTAHPRMGQHRDNSPLWKPTSKYKVKRHDTNSVNGKYKNYFYDERICYSHEYIGKLNN